MPTAKRSRPPARAASKAKLNSSDGRISRSKKLQDAASLSGNSDFEIEAELSPAENATKRQKMASSSRSVKVNDTLRKKLFARDYTETSKEPCLPPSRQHSITYHRPLLLDKDVGSQGRRTLLSWFHSVSESRSMPWRKAWIDPKTISGPVELRTTLEKRAYEVWISEIMLQQTRVATVIDYWTRWMAKWPTIHDLAAAKSEDVLAMWSGLGYYSRATRIHEAAKLAVADPDMKGLLPSSAKDLEAKMPGVGAYTAGAISCIVFGNPSAMVDGNVFRVLSRQLGIHGNVKTDKAIIDTIWAAADALVKATSELDGDDGLTNAEPNERPGQWGQALMELGSTICTPNPNCSQCPITSTCRVYTEGELQAEKSKEASLRIPDIEDACTLCEPFEGSIEDSDDESAKDKKRGKAKKPDAKQSKQATLTAFAFTKKIISSSSSLVSAPSTAASTPSKETMEAITGYARRFPIKAVKKAARIEETLVCAIRRGDGQYLIQRRPLKGLLAGLWEFPSRLLETPAKTDKKKREQLSLEYVSKLLQGTKAGKKPKLTYKGELGSIDWQFTHIKLTMHVHLFTVGENAMVTEDDDEQPRQWVVDVDAFESMGTGMRKCWNLVKAEVGEL
ncbi:DNA glycosylase [Trichoderma austrokoningii]